MTDEVELKLDLTRDAAEALSSHEILSGNPRRQDLRSVYFDTPSRTLSKAGFALRIRHVGDARLQTVKASGTLAAGLFVRPEWEQSVQSDRPVLDDTTPLRALFGSALDDVVELFEVRVERCLWDVSVGKSRIEVALDRGEIAAGDRRVPICELELELKAGEPDGLFAFARSLDAIAPVRIGVRNKSERGYGLLDALPQSFKAEPVEIAPESSAAEAFAAIIAACLRQFRLNEPLIAVGNPEGVHQARVALRRLRSAFSTFKPLLKERRAASLAAELKWLAGTLGPARDLDVMLSSQPMPDADGARLETARNDAYRTAIEALNSPRARAVPIDLTEWVAIHLRSGDKGDPLQATSARTFAASALKRYRRRIRKAANDLEALSDEARHEVRKDAKKLRYTVEFFLPLFEKRKAQRRARRFVKALEALQDSLGQLNDTAAAPTVLKEVGLADLARHFAVPPEAQAADRRKAADAFQTFRDRKPFWR